MFRYFKALWYFCTGRFSAAAAAWNENPYVMEATYDAAIGKSKARYDTVKKAVAELIVIENERKAEIIELGKEIESINDNKQGAQIAMQRRIDELKRQNKSKEEIMLDGEFLRHKTAFDNATTNLPDKLKRMKDKEADLKKRQDQVANYKIELQEMQRAAKDLKSEKQEALADVAVARQSEEINEMLAGIESSSADQDLAAARDARKRAVARATVAQELAGTDTRNADREYAALAQRSKSNAELDNLLNWGDDKSEKTLEPAKLQE